MPASDHGMNLKMPRVAILPAELKRIVALS
jgi:hypothetical protein